MKKLKKDYDHYEPPKDITKAVWVLLVTLTIGCLLALFFSGCEKDCYKSGARITTLHTVLSGVETIDTLDSKGFTRDCDLIDSRIVFVSSDTVENKPDTLIFTKVVERFGGPK